MAGKINGAGIESPLNIMETVGSIVRTVLSDAHDRLPNTVNYEWLEYCVRKGVYNALKCDEGCNLRNDLYECILNEVKNSRSLCTNVPPGETNDFLDIIFSTIRREHRAIFSLYIKGEKMKAIGERVGITENSVSQILLQIRAQLRAFCR
jgi:DNA-directed RNA polymerase specialized sigma subunit